MQTKLVVFHLITLLATNMAKRYDDQKSNETLHIELHII
ncbi:hypothetical protein JCM19239_922 [Vibrio variabilis]|uniref:Uncharacterized protein n=1 Tax=Vibrio variabilis TaxID=990271 RepID=A0ABQ0JBV4_9VIBR|nr:hypothetical protein JCM19239_922 [Vibrio variabilis]